VAVVQVAARVGGRHPPSRRRRRRGTVRQHEPGAVVDGRQPAAVRARVRRDVGVSRRHRRRHAVTLDVTVVTADVTAVTVDVTAVTLDVTAVTLDVTAVTPDVTGRRRVTLVTRQQRVLGAAVTRPQLGRPATVDASSAAQSTCNVHALSSALGTRSRAVITVVHHRWKSVYTGRVGNSCYPRRSICKYKITRMWANAQRDGRPAEHR